MFLMIKKGRTTLQDLPPRELALYFRINSNKRGEMQEDCALFTRTTLRYDAKAGAEGGIAWTFSTFDLDRFDERVDPAGWDLAEYQKNPVVLWAHNHDIPAIGTSRNLQADKSGLHGIVDFNERDFDPFGWGIGERVRRNVIRAGSVGFRIMEVEFPEDKNDDGSAVIFRKQELLEFSICNVPANPFALASEEYQANHEQRNEELPANRRQPVNRSVNFWAGVMNGGNK